MRGGLLYTDFVDNKPPLLYAYYAAAQVLGGRGLFAVHLLTALCVVPLTALAVSACYATRRTGMIAALTFLLVQRGLHRPRHAGDQRRNPHGVACVVGDRDDA